MSERRRDGDGSNAAANATTRRDGNGSVVGVSSEDADGVGDMSDLFDQLEELEETVDTDAEREQVREAMQAVKEADTSSVFGSSGNAPPCASAGAESAGPWVVS